VQQRIEIIVDLVAKHICRFRFWLPDQSKLNLSWHWKSAKNLVMPSGIVAEPIDISVIDTN